MKRCAREPEKEPLFSRANPFLLTGQVLRKKLGGLQLAYGHVSIEISRNERHTPTPATEFPFNNYYWVFLFSQIQSELSNSFSTNFLNTSEDAGRMP